MDLATNVEVYASAASLDYITGLGERFYVLNLLAPEFYFKF
jgi:hypothetical protein